MLLFFCQLGLAQIIISGSVLDEDNKGLPGANIIISEEGKITIAAFAFADEVGNYSLTVNAETDTINIKVTHLGYAETSHSVINKSQTVNFSLRPTVQELKEVFVKAPPPIKQRGDTLDYTVSQFKGKGDRVIADVLRKMPGIEVEADGRILYQGNPIQKYYIEGLDLLEGKYNLANNNLPADAVSKVQILENHQPIKLLDSLVFSDKASLNIKLKNNITATGAAKIGAGFSPFLWDVNVTPMLFSKKHQFIASYQANNAGIDVSREIKTLTIDNAEEFLEEKSRDWVGIQQLSFPPFSERLWLDNNAHLITANYLVQLKKDHQLKVNVSYLNDGQFQEGRTATQIFTPGDTVAITEDKQNKLHFNSLEGKLVWFKNTKDSYLKNTLDFRGSWNTQHGFIRNTISDDIIQQADIPDYSFSNTLEGIIPLGKELLHIYSKIAYDNVPQSLQVWPGQFADALNDGDPYDKIIQDLNLNKFNIDNSIHLIKSLGAFTIMPKVGFITGRDHLTSRMYTEEGDERRMAESEFRNNFYMKRSLLYAEASAQYKSEQWRLTLRVPFKFYKFDLENRNLGNNESYNRFIPEPTINISNDLNAFWRANLSIGVGKDFGVIDQLYSGFIMRDYRSLNAFNSVLPERVAQNYRLQFRYRNPVKSNFFSASYRFRRSKNNLIYENLFLPDGRAVSQTSELDNYANSHLIYAKVSKFIYPIKGLFSIGTSLDLTNTEQLIDTELAKVRNRGLGFNAKLNSNITGWMEAELYANLRFIHTQTKDNDNDAKNQSYTGMLNFHPLEKHQLIATGEAYRNTFPGFASKTEYFLRFKYRYTVSKRVELEALWNNVLNTEQFTNVYNEDYIYRHSEYILRPSQFLVNMRFSF
ncbi:carboxypeptidase-like regulatory domain-containing protein [Sinomicrobium sp. M5D2P9]